jgi:hypothetical protein
MKKMGQLWAEVGVALRVGRRPDLDEAKAIAGRLKAEIRQAAALKPGDAEFAGLMKELGQAADRLVTATAGKKSSGAIEAFDRMGSHHCHRCHVKMRWNLIRDLSAFPGGLP